MGTFEGIPSPYDEKKRVVIPNALKCLRLKNHRKFARLGDLSKMYGWKSMDVVKKLKVKSEEFYKAKMAELKAKSKAEAAVAGDLTKALGKDAALAKSMGILA